MDILSQIYNSIVQSFEQDAQYQSEQEDKALAVGDESTAQEYRKRQSETKNVIAQAKEQWRKTKGESL